MLASGPGKGPFAVSQFVTPGTPAITQLPTPDGAPSPNVPVTIAVMVIVPPKVGVPDVVKAIVGVVKEAFEEDAKEFEVSREIPDTPAERSIVTKIREVKLLKWE